MSLPGSKLTDITFHRIVESSPNAVVLVNQEGRIAYVNRHFELLFGYKIDELIGKPVDMLVPESLRGHHAAYRRSYTQAPSTRAMGMGRELRALRKDGSEFPIEIGLNPLVLVDGTWVLATIIDISARKNVQEQFRKIVHSAPYAMVVANETGQITLVNQQAIDLFGYAEQEIVGRQLEILLPERFRAHHVSLREGFFASPQIRYMGAGRELFALRKDGTEVQVEVGLNPMRMEDGLRILASITDITVRKAQEELRAKKEAAEAAYKAKGEMLAVASHDLKNPLSAIAGLSEIMLEMKKAEPDASKRDIEFLQNIHEASRHMADVVKGILANEGLEQQGLRLEEVDASAMCRDLAAFNGPAAARKQIELSTEIEADIVLQADKNRLREAFDNYLSNAIKYSPPGMGVSVTLKALPGESQVEFGVRDHGPGLTEDDKANLFGKFRKLSAKPTAGESSTGLGLSIVKAIIEMHGGSVGCDSVHGQGAYFWARLPVRTG